MALAEAVLTPAEPRLQRRQAAGRRGGSPAEAAEPALPDVDEVVTELAEPLTGPDAQAPAPEADPPRRRPPRSAAAEPGSARSGHGDAPAPAPEAPVQAARDACKPRSDLDSGPPGRGSRRGCAAGAARQRQHLAPLRQPRRQRPREPAQRRGRRRRGRNFDGHGARDAVSTAPNRSIRPLEPAAERTRRPQPRSATENQAQPAPEPTEQWDWTWQWSCGDAIPPEIVLPGNSLLADLELELGLELRRRVRASGGNSESQLPTQYHACRDAVSADQHQHFDSHLEPGQRRAGDAGERRADECRGRRCMRPSPLIDPVVQPGPGDPAPVRRPRAAGDRRRRRLRAGRAHSPVAPPSASVDARRRDRRRCRSRSRSRSSAASRLATAAGGARPSTTAADRRPAIAGMLGTAAGRSQCRPHCRGDTAGATAPVPPPRRAGFRRGDRGAGAPAAGGRGRAGTPRRRSS